MSVKDAHIEIESRSDKVSGSSIDSESTNSENTKPVNDKSIITIDVPDDNRALQTLQTYFGYDSFRHVQADVIDRTLNGLASLVIMPTGGGKSICYQLPALMLPGITIVISPLIALMQDQVNALQLSGIQADALNSLCDDAEEQMIRSRAEAGELKLLYVSPERAVSWNFLQWAAGLKVSQIAIDEAHCVSIWGNDFRPEYTRLTELTRLFSSIPVVALTATADPATQLDIGQQLALNDHRTFVSSFERSNIHIDVLPAKNRYEVILDFLGERHAQALDTEVAAGIVYCLSRKSTEEMAEKLRGAGYKAAHYHGAMNSDKRAEVQDQFLRDEVQIVCATIAFGMGIDKPNIRWVIHYNLPKNIESYYQEIGRAGRDGMPAKALLFTGFGDMKTLTGFIEKSDATDQFKQVQFAKLDRLWEFTQTLSCRTNFVLNYFGEHRVAGCGHCDHCLNPPLSFDGTVIAQKALSAVYRIQHQFNQNVGLNTLVDVLRGSGSRAILEAGFHELKTYGAGQDLSWKEWAHYITQLIDRGLLAIDFSRGSSLNLTQLSMQILKEGKAVQLCEPREYKPLDDTVKTKKTAANEADFSELENALYIALKDLRKELADEKQVPAYTVFSDASLKDMCRLKPGNLGGFMKVTGVGEHKCDTYGEAFIEVIEGIVPEAERTFINKQHRKKQPSNKNSRSEFSMPKLGETHRATYALYQQGMSSKEIAKERELSHGTIVAHLYRLAFYGEAIEIDQLALEDEIETIQSEWQSLKMPDRIKPVFEALSDKYSDEERYSWEKIRYAIALKKRAER